MSRLPDRFDLWIRKAREHSDPERQTDYILGSLVGLKEWHLLNIGSQEKPQAARTEIGDDPCLVVFTDVGRIEDLIQVSGAVRHLPDGAPVPAISIPTAAVLPWCIECRVGVLINPGEDAVMIPFKLVEGFYAEWSKRGGREASSFWIPNMTTEEEDFWQEHGL